MEELLDCCPLTKTQKKSEILDALISQENTVSSYLGHGIALPHIKIKMRKTYLFALGRVRKPFKDATVHASEKIQLIVLLLASDKVESYLTILSSFAKISQTNPLDEDSFQLPLEDFKKQFLSLCKNVPVQRSVKRKDNAMFNRLILRDAIKLAKAGNCSSIFFFQDTFDSLQNIKPIFAENLKIVVITHRITEVSQQGSIYTLPVQFFASGRLSQLRSAILLGLIHKYIDYNEKICCIGGILNSNCLDTVAIIDVKHEIQSTFSQQTDILPSQVRPEVFERLLSIATELAVEGREGKPVGCMFVLGELKSLEPYMHPLILNPFFGYKAEDRNLLNPFIDETIKEYSLLDGAFVISGDGIVESAGSLIHTDRQVKLPGGLGTRHAAAVAISQAVDCVAITVSSSSGQVSLFRKGKMLPLFDRGIGDRSTEV